MSDERYELEPAAGGFVPPSDARPKMPEPLPVRLIAVADVTLPAITGLERQMDDLYIKLLKFERAAEIEGLAYQADNFRLIFDVREPPVGRDSYRPVQVEIPCLADLERLLMEREMEYTRQKGLLPGSESLLLRDASGNWVEVLEYRPVA